MDVTGQYEPEFHRYTVRVDGKVVWARKHKHIGDFELSARQTQRLAREMQLEIIRRKNGVTK